MWLDLARYADSAGYGSDPLRMTIYRYRDWVIDAFNRNFPYDQFTVEQIAGDLLPNPTQDQLIATAFHRNTMTNTEGGTDDEEWRVAAVKDRTDMTFQVWMGLDDGLRPMPHAQVRPDHAAGVLLVVRVLQPDRGQRPAERGADDPDAGAGAGGAEGEAGRGDRER